jgi:type I restriction enzyme M protein
MRKNLGSKRKEIHDEARREIVRIYESFLNGDAGEGETAKIFATTDFGYREIRVERPLRLNFQASKERIERLNAEKAFERLGGGEQENLLKALGKLPPKLFTNREAFEKALIKVTKAKDLRLGAQLKKAVLSALSERDEEADICLDADGNPEADSDLRDHELVPLGEDWREYMKREVLPFVPDAWVDESYVDQTEKKIGRIGYEINFNRYFYKYVPPRPLEEIDAELKSLESEIANLLKEVAA